MYCYHCGCLLSEYDYCTACGADVKMYKKIMQASNYFYNEGLEKARVRDLSGAIISLRQALKFNKNHMEARNLLGLVYFELGEVPAALSEWVISQSLRQEKNMATDYIALIQSSASRLDDYNSSIRKYNQAYEYCLEKSKDLAIIQVKSALQKNPKYIRAHKLLALLYIDDEQWEKAERELHKVLRVDHNNLTALRYLAEVEKMLEPDDMEKRPSKNSKDDILRYQSDNELIIQPANVREPKNSGIGTLLNILIGLIIGAAAVYFLVVPARVAQVNTESTAVVKELGEQIDAKNSSIQELENQTQTLKEQVQKLQESLDEYSGDQGTISQYDALMQIASDYLTQRDTTATAEAMEALGVQVELSDMSDAFWALYQTMLTVIGPELSDTYYAQGLEAYRAEEYDKAIDLLSKAFSYNQSNEDALYNLANAYRKMGNYDSAAPYYEQLIEMFPETERATKSQQYLEEITAQ